jgi:outer membrane autotransporter protein
MVFLATNALAQTLTAPPTQNPPPGTTFSSVNANTVTANARGVINLVGGTVTLTKTIFNTANFADLLASGNGAIILAIGVTVVDTNRAFLPSATNINLSVNAAGRGQIYLLGGSITATGTNLLLSNNRAYGINAGVGGFVNAAGVTIETFGSNSNGVVAAGGIINLAGGSVTTNGQSAIGLQANGNAGPAIIRAGGTQINTLGLLAFGATVDGANPSVLRLTNATVNTSGLGAAGLGVFGSASGSKIFLDNTEVNTVRGDGIDWTGQSSATVTLRNGSQINPGSGLVLLGLPSLGSNSLNLVATGNSVLTGAILNATNVSIESGSIWNVTDTSLVTKNVTVTGGTIAFQSAAKFARQGQASVLAIGGNYSMESSLSLGIGGTRDRQYDHLQILGNASLSGTLNVSPLGNFHPVAGNAFEIIRAQGGRTGQFGLINDSLNNNPGLQRVDVYAPNGVALVYLPAGVGPSPGPIPDIIPIPLPPVDPDNPIPVPEEIAILDPTAEELTSLYEISFSGANIQRFNLDERLTEIQRGSTGFSSNTSVYNSPTSYDGKRSVADEKSGKETPPIPQPTPQNRWGVWSTGWGDFVDVQGSNIAKGYNFTTGGVTVGIDYRIMDHLAIGVFGSYAHTWTDLNPGSVDVNTGRGGLYATYFNHGFYVNAAAFGGYNSYDTSRAGLLGFASGNTDGGEFSTFVDAGYDLHLGNFTIGPIAALQYTYVSVSGFSETGSLIPLRIHSDSQDSLRTDLGGKASFTWRVGSILIIPSTTAAWEHEYKYSALPISASSSLFGGATATFFGPSEGHDSAIINAGVGIQWTPRISTYVGYQGQLGRDRYDSNAVSGGVSFSF